MKKLLTIFLLIIGGLAANILVNTAVIAAWGLIDGEIIRGVLAGTASIAVMCALAVLIVKKSQIKRRTLLIFAQTPALVISLAVFVLGASEYHDVMTFTGSGDMWSGLRYGLTIAFFEIYTVIFITVLTMTAVLAATLGITYYKSAHNYGRIS